MPGLDELDYNAVLRRLVLSKGILPDLQSLGSSNHTKKHTPQVWGHPATKTPYDYGRKTTH